MSPIVALGYRSFNYIFNPQNIHSVPHCSRKTGGADCPNFWNRIWGYPTPACSVFIAVRSPDLITSQLWIRNNINSFTSKSRISSLFLHSLLSFFLSSPAAWIKVNLFLLLQSALQPLVCFGLLYDFFPQSSIFTLLSPVSHFHRL